jgi:hypothetical protein
MRAVFDVVLVPRMNVVVKTFMRPDVCHRLLRSVRSYLSEANLIVVDDSQQPTDFDCDTYERVHRP